MNSGTYPLVSNSCATIAGATRSANRTAAPQSPFTSAVPTRASHSPARRASGTSRSPSSVRATVSARSASRSDSAPWPRASDAMIDHSVSASNAPRSRTLTETASSRSSNRPKRRAVRARIDAPPNAVRSRSVNSNSTFGGRILRFFKVQLPSEFPENPIFARKP